MKILHGFIGFVFWLIILALGGLLVANCFDMACDVPGWLLNDRAERLVVGGALVLLAVVYGVSAIPARKDERFVSYECDGGKVSVSVKAINSLLSKLAEEFAGIVSLRAAVYPGDKSVQLDMAVKSGAKIQELSQALQQRVRERMQDSLGISDVGAVRVFVREIVLPEDSPGKDREDQGEWQNIPI